MSDTPGRNDDLGPDHDAGRETTPAANTDSSTGGPDARTGGGQPQEDVEDRPSVSTVTPEDYPERDRADSRP